MLDQGFYVDAPPPKASEQREVVRMAVEGQGSSASAPAPPHEVALFLVQPAMLGGRDLAVELSISAERSSREIPRTSMLRRSASPSNSDQSVKLPAASKSRSRRGAVVDVCPSLGGHHAVLVSPMQVTPITG